MRRGYGEGRCATLPSRMANWRSASLLEPRQYPGRALSPARGPELYLTHGRKEAAYAAIAAMSSTVSLAMAGFIFRTAAPARAPL